MKFCPFCESYLIIDNINRSNVYDCKACPYRKKIIETEVFKYQNIPKKIKNQVFSGDDAMKYAATCDKRCNKCESNEAMFVELQTRSADEPMTIFYQCVNCKNTWKE